MSSSKLIQVPKIQTTPAATPPAPAVSVVTEPLRPVFQNWGNPNNSATVDKISQPVISNDVETRLQKLERDQKVVRRGRIMPATPQFRTQSSISSTSANNPFAVNTVDGANFPPGTVPDTVAPTTNSRIKYPATVEEV